MRLSLLFLLLALALAACGGGPKKRVFPPEARLQELQRLDDGGLRLQLRLHNYSNVPMRFERVDLELRLDDAAAGRIALTPALQVAASSVEIVEARLAPPPAVLQAVDAALADGRPLRYRLAGTLATEAPRGHYDLEFASTLDRVPGLDRVLR